MKTPFTILSALTIALACSSALAQVGGTDLPTLDASPMAGLSTSPAAGASVGPVGIPLGAMELAAPGISPPPIASGCPTAGIPGMAPAMAPFDGGGMAAASPASCAQGGSLTGSAPTDSGTMPMPPALSAGRAGIPLGSTEIGGPGLSPMPATTLLPPLLASPTMTVSPSVGASPTPLEPPCPVTGSFTDGVTVRAIRQAGTSTGAASPGC